jgi:hypothetical protein
MLGYAPHPSIPQEGLTQLLCFTERSGRRAVRAQALVFPQVAVWTLIARTPTVGAIEDSRRFHTGQLDVSVNNVYACLHCSLVRSADRAQTTAPYSWASAMEHFADHGALLLTTLLPIQNFEE